MVALGYSVVSAEVTQVNTSRVWITPLQGPRKGVSVCLPLMSCEEPEFVDEGDDEIVLADWMILKENLR